MLPELEVVCFDSFTISTHRSAIMKQEVGRYRRREFLSSFFHTFQKNGATGFETLHRRMEEAFWRFSYGKVYFMNTLLYIDRSYDLLSL